MHQFNAAISDRMQPEPAADTPPGFFVHVQGEVVPALGLGTFQLLGDVATRAVEHALDIGYRHIDTARIYRNEKEVGRGLKNSSLSRDEFFLTTKVRWDSLRADRVRESAESSLVDLQVEYLDLLLVHWPNVDVPLEETLGEMNELLHEGKIRRVGVSNFPTAWLQRALKLAPIFCNQVEYHPMLAQRKLLKMAREHDLLLTAYSPFAQGEIIGARGLDDVAEKHGKSPTQVVLRWLIQQDGVAAIPRSASAEHRASNFDIWDFSLDEDDMAAVARMDRQNRVVRPRWEPDWD